MSLKKKSLPLSAKIGWSKNPISMDKKGFDIIYRTYFRILYLYSLKIVGKSEAAEDIVQDVFEDCWSRRETIDWESPIKPYLYKLVRNKSIDFTRLSANHSVVLTSTDQELESIIYQLFTTHNYIFSHELQTEINHAVNNLPQKCQEVFLLSRFESLKNKEIAGKLNIHIKTVEKHITSAIKSIKDHLEQVGYLTLYTLTLFFNSF